MARDDKKTKMTSIDDGSPGILSVSKSQKQRAARLSRMKGRQPIAHGGVCSKCGQRSTSCVTNTTHLSCAGFFKGDFEETMFNNLRARCEMAFDYSPCVCPPAEGIWISEGELQRRREERVMEMRALLRLQTHIHVAPIEEGARLGKVTFTNGLGEPVAWHNGAWRHLDEIQKDPIETEPLVASEERILVELVDDGPSVPMTPERQAEIERYIDSLELPDPPPPSNVSPLDLSLS